jgi:polyisoprenoid-binding protein YceI
MVKPLLFFCVLVASVAAQAQDWKVDYGKSRISFVIRQMNVPVEGGFKRFIAQVSFDPAKVENAKIRVELDMTSIDTGSAEGDEEVRRPLWFDMARHPRATFVSQSIARQADGRYTARGNLAIKGRTRVVDVPFSLARQADGAWLAEGKLPVRRADFDIGGGDWNDVVANEAEARFRIWLKEQGT